MSGNDNPEQRKSTSRNTMCMITDIDSPAAFWNRSNKQQLFGQFCNERGPVSILRQGSLRADDGSM